MRHGGWWMVGFALAGFVMGAAFMQNRMARLAATEWPPIWQCNGGPLTNNPRCP